MKDLLFKTFDMADVKTLKEVKERIRYMILNGTAIEEDAIVLEKLNEYLENK